MIDPLDPRQVAEPVGNGAAATAHGLPSVETLLFGAGLISADQLGELVRDAVLQQRPVAALALERGLVTPEALQVLLAQTGANVSVAELLGETSEAAAATPPMPAVFDPAPTVIEMTPVEEWPAATIVTPLAAPTAPAEPAVLETVAPVPTIDLAPPAPVPMLEPKPVEPAPAAVAAPSAYSLLLRLQTGERVVVDKAASFDSAAALARMLADRFATASEWPLIAGRCIRPEAVVSIDIERAFEA